MYNGRIEVGDARKLSSKYEMPMLLSMPRLGDSLPRLELALRGIAAHFCEAFLSMEVVSKGLKPESVAFLSDYLNRSADRCSLDTGTLGFV